LAAAPHAAAATPPLPRRHPGGYFSKERIPAADLLRCHGKIKSLK